MPKKIDDLHPMDRLDTNIEMTHTLHKRNLRVSLDDIYYLLDKLMHFGDDDAKEVGCRCRKSPCKYPLCNANREMKGNEKYSGDW